MDVRVADGACLSWNWLGVEKRLEDVEDRERSIVSKDWKLFVDFSSIQNGAPVKVDFSSIQGESLECPYKPWTLFILVNKP